MRYIIIGYGNIGKKRHMVLKGKCLAIVDPFLKGADYSDCKDVPLNLYDAAVVSVPNAIKMDILKYLMKNGKHALVEKPLLFEDEFTAEEFDSSAKASRAIWYTSYNHRFEPLVKKLKELLYNGVIGQPYFVNFIYGNGTVANIIGTWRDAGYGVLEDLGCHLLDLAAYLFPSHQREYRIIGADNFEANTIDYCAFARVYGRFHFLCTTLMWKNTFSIDVFASKGSLHLYGLHKWGKSQLIHRERVFPSGVPGESVITSSGEDKTWEEDIAYFEKMIASGKSSYENDLYITGSINALVSNIKAR